MDPYIILAKTEQGMWIETKEIGTNHWSLQQSSKNSWSLHKERILKRGKWSILRKGQFSSKFVQNDQISIRDIKETHETGQNSKNKWNLQPIGLSTQL